MLKSLIPLELNNDQRREFVNTQQRFSVWRDARQRMQESRGSMVWQHSGDKDYLARSYYDKSGTRRQTSLGPRSSTTEQIKSDFETSRASAKARYAEVDAALKRQSAINRALGLGRVPLTGARILRLLDESELLGRGVKVVGTNALYAYEAAAGVIVDPGITATGDIDLLFDSRRNVRFVVSEDVPERSLLKLLRSVDTSFERSGNAYRATNAQGYMVDLIKPLRDPPWKPDRHKLGNDEDGDLSAAEIEGLVWLENAPSFEQVVIDDRGEPLRLVATDPRAWAVHKHWLAQRTDRDPIKKHRDAEQAAVAAYLVHTYFPHLPFVPDQMRSIPLEIVEAAAPLFAP
jgi:hypothetical protein